MTLNHGKATNIKYQQKRSDCIWVDTHSDSEWEQCSWSRALRAIYCCCCCRCQSFRLYHCRLGRVGIVEADYARGQLHSSKAPADSVRSTGYKTEVSQPKPFVCTSPAENLVTLFEKGELYSRLKPSVRITITLYFSEVFATYPGAARIKLNLSVATLPITVSLIGPAIRGRPSDVINPMYGITSALQRNRQTHDLISP